MKKIVLSGELGKKFGRVHFLDVRSPAESIRALCATIEGFRKFVFSSGERNVAYKAILSNDELDVKQLQNPMGEREVFNIVPVIMGAGAVGRIIAGAVLIAAGTLLTVFSAGTGAAIGGYMINAGVALTIGGVAQLLVGHTPADIGEKDKGPQSTSFNGPVNTTAQGHPVPILYGRMIVGSQVISAGIKTEVATSA